MVPVLQKVTLTRRTSILQGRRGVFGRRRGPLHCMKHFYPQQIKIGPAKHLAFEKFQAIHMSSCLDYLSFAQTNDR